MVDNVKVSNMPGRFWPKGLDSVTVLLLLVVYVVKKNSAYGRHQLSRPMWIVGPIQI